jgi:hypothetical protein
MNTKPVLMLLAEDNPSDADLILVSLSGDGYAGAVHVVHDGLRRSISFSAVAITPTASWSTACA